MRATFSNLSIQERFTEDGVVVIKELFSKELIQEIQKIYQDFNIPLSEGFYVSNWVFNGQTPLIHEELTNLAYSLIASQLIDYKPIFSCFAIKRTSQDNSSEMGIHQDWSFVDETKFVPISAWIPLCDVNNTNGCMSFFKGSQNIFQNIRGQNIRSQIEYIHPEMDPYFTDYPLKTGDVLFLNSRIVHRSYPNHSSEDRIAMMMALIPKEANVKAYVKDLDHPQMIAEYDCPDNFYLEYIITENPKLPISRKFIDENNKFSKEEALNVLNKHI